MGFHTCMYCRNAGVVPETSSGDVVLAFLGGEVFRVPDMLPHYILEHGYVPPPEFCSAVMTGTLEAVNPHRPRREPKRVGYLEFPDTLSTPSQVAEFAANFGVDGRLKLLAAVSCKMREASKMGNRVQTRGVR